MDNGGWSGKLTASDSRPRTKAKHQTDETAGLIPRAIDMIFTVSSQLRDRGWKYQMEGQFLEVYNEVVSLPIVPEVGADS